MKLTPTLGGAYSGSFGGLTASRNRGGQYLRRRAVPVNPNTTSQVLVRNALAGVMQRWNETLDDVQRGSWRTYAENVSWIDSLGQTIQLSGAQMYLRTNSIIARSNAQWGTSIAFVDDAPSTYTLGPLVDFTSTTATWSPADEGPPEVPQKVIIDLQWATAIPTGAITFGYLGRSVSPSISFYKAPYQQMDAGIGNTDGAGWSIEPGVTSAVYIERYGVPQPGTKLFGFLRVLTADGRLSGKADFDVTVVAVP